MDRRSFLTGAPLLPGMLAAARAEEGFTSLFDGQTLNGWHVEQGPESAFYVSDGAIVVHEGANYPTWLRSDRVYENFDFRCEFFLKGWMNSGVFLHAPEHGRPTWNGFEVEIFHKQDKEPLPESMGAIFPLIAPLSATAHKQGEWNGMRILMDWPSLQVWINGTQVQNLDVENHPELRHRLRRGYLGLQSLSYPTRFRNLRVRELPSRETWTTLYDSPADMAKWQVAEGQAKWEPLGRVLRSDGLGYLATREQFQDFELHSYIRASEHSNGGIIFRADLDPKSERRYEIQIHDVEEATYPTGSLYFFQRARYPRIEPEQWYLLQLVVKGRDCLVRINGGTVMEYNRLENLQAGHILLQAHQQGKWIEYKQIRVKPA